MKAVIIGDRIARLSTAILLHRQGIEVTLLEHSIETLEGCGAYTLLCLPHDHIPIYMIPAQDAVKPH